MLLLFSARTNTQYRECTGNIILPPTPTGCAVRSFSTTQAPLLRAYRNTCNATGGPSPTPAPAVTEPPMPGGGAIGTLVALAVVVIAVNVWYWNSKKAEAAAAHTYSTMEEQHEEL